ncbi:DUF4932 domain-containing protein [Paraflavitalea pollutisoli]|uniref:DUF4932 domain-containing protein n=1 Tax=Paraflavitalea pollutisoli TaxID=3034143 RepID=UPI0023ECE87F|nr:DUF4932 domain-containing protein [Paraflavitalea sp. H1-2-19X]
MNRFRKLLPVLLCLVTGSAALAHPAPKPAFKSFKFEYGGVNFSVDPRIELYQAVVLASGVPLTNYIDIDYKTKVDLYMEKHKNHPLLQFSKRHLHNGLFGYIDAPIWFLLHLDNNFDWRKDLTYDQAKDKKIDSFRTYLKQFVAETDYAQFFNSNEAFYNISLKSLAFNLENFQEKERVLNYYGVKKQEDIQFNLVLNFFGWGNFGPRLRTAKGRELYAVIAPTKSFMRIPTFDQGRLYNLVWHEFGHSFANPACEKQPYADQLQALSHLHEPIKESMKQQAYAEWFAVVREHLTEAVALRLAAQKFGEAFAEQNYVRPQKGRRWIYLWPLLEALKQYETNRATYPTLEDFMPKIVEAFKSVTQADIDQWMAAVEAIRKPDVEKMPQIGDIFRKDSILIILSSQEKDTAADARLKAFIKGFVKLIPNTAKGTMITDAEVSKYDLSQYNLFVVGTPTGNAVVQQVMAQLPIKITDDGVIASKQYDGKGYMLMAGWVNPWNTQKIMTVITALNPDDMVNFNRAPFGGSGYHILKNLITYKTGSFARSGLIWGCD